MRRSIILVTVVFSFIASCLVLSGIASADQETYSETLGPLEYLHIQFGSSTDMSFSWDVESSGNSIDVYLIDADQLTSFKTSIFFEYYDEFSLEGISSGGVEGTLPPGDYELIFMNSYESGTVTFTANLTVNYGPAAGLMSVIIIVGLIAAAIVVAFLLYLNNKRKKQMRYMPPAPLMPPQPPYRGPQYQQPMPPPPSVVCPKCSSTNPNESMFCKQCGTKLR